MNYHRRLVATCLMTAVVVGCGRSRPGDDRMQADVLAGQADHATPDKRIVALVSWLKHKGVTLELTGVAEDHTGWKITQPRTSDEYDVVFIIRSFPSEASEEQMR